MGLRLPKFLRDLGSFVADWSSPELYAKITVTPSDGTTRIEAFNGNGQNCLELTQEIEDAMGGVTSREMKPEGLRTVRDEDPRARITGRDIISH